MNIISPKPETIGIPQGESLFTRSQSPKVRRSTDIVVATALVIQVTQMLMNQRNTHPRNQKRARERKRRNLHQAASQSIALMMMCHSPPKTQVMT
jgi:hypothetical protein